MYSRNFCLAIYARLLRTSYMEKYMIRFPYLQPQRNSNLPRIFLRLRFKRRILFFLHFSRILTLNTMRLIQVQAMPFARWIDDDGKY